MILKINSKKTISLKEIEVPSIKYCDSFEQIGKSVTDFLNKCTTDHLSVESLNIKAGEVTKAIVFNIDTI